MAKAAVTQPAAAKTAEELSFWVAECMIGEETGYVCGAANNEPDVSLDIDIALKFADEDSVDRLMGSLSFTQYEPVEHSMSV